VRCARGGVGRCCCTRAGGHLRVQPPTRTFIARAADPMFSPIVVLTRIMLGVWARLDIGGAVFDGAQPPCHAQAHTA
jgi:hypothetical protein